MLVYYCNEDLRKVMVELLGSLEVMKVNAAYLEKVLREFVEKPCEYADGFVCCDEGQQDRPRDQDAPVPSNTARY